MSKRPVYQYRVPAKGSFDDISTITITALEKELKTGPDCLMAYCMFPSDSDILHKAVIDVDKKGVNGVNLLTYSKLWEGRENDLKECLEENLQKVMPSIELKGDVEDKGLTGEMPKTLYHITERDNLPAILEKGLQPGQGSNGYKTTDDYVYLSDIDSVAPWLAVLKHLENPVILEIDAEGITSLEPGRVFNDRDFASNGYGEYRTKGMIYPEELREAQITKYNALGVKIMSDCVEQIEKAKSSDEVSEAVTGIRRAALLGVINEKHAEQIIERHGGKDILKQTAVTDTKPLKDEVLPWDEPDAFDEAVKGISSFYDKYMDKN